MIVLMTGLSALLALMGEPVARDVAAPRGGASIRPSVRPDAPPSCRPVSRR